MHPKLFDIGPFTVYAYGLFIVIGAAMAYRFLSSSAHKAYGIDPDKISSLLVWIVVSAFVGGKLFFYLEDPARYLAEPAQMIIDVGNGFVFYGSLLFAVPTTIWFFRKESWPIWGMLDLIAFTTLIVHAFGRFGCFMAGCCHGIPTQLPWGVSFTDPLSQAEPLGVPLHPTQLYEMALLAAIFTGLWLFRRKKSFDGQLFLIYVMLYAFGRSVIEVFRGDEARGYIVDGWLSHSQFISACLIALIMGVYVILQKQSRKSHRH
jgi:phosphatidylglycerol:prolipoprotein diacylglycerol transferase